MDTLSSQPLEQLVALEVREQLKNLPPSFRKYRGEIDGKKVIRDAVNRLPRGFKIDANSPSSRQLQQVRLRVAVEKSIAAALHELQFYYVVRSEIEDDECPTEPLSFV